VDISPAWSDPWPHVCLVIVQQVCFSLIEHSGVASANIGRFRDIASGREQLIISWCKQTSIAERTAAVRIGVSLWRVFRIRPAFRVMARWLLPSMLRSDETSGSESSRWSGRRSIDAVFHRMFVRRIRPASACTQGTALPPSQLLNLKTFDGYCDRNLARFMLLSLCFCSLPFQIPRALSGCRSTEGASSYVSFFSV